MSYSFPDKAYRGAADLAARLFAPVARSFQERFARHEHPDSRGWLQRCLDEEVAQRRLFPWTAVAFGLGILLCFAAEGRPHPAAPVFGLGVCALTGWLGRHDHRICRVVIGLAMVLAGFTAALVRFERVDAPYPHGYADHAGWWGRSRVSRSVPAMLASSFGWMNSGS